MGAWITNQNSVAALIESDAKIEVRVTSVEDTVHRLEIQTAADRQHLLAVKEDISDIKSELKEVKSLLISIAKARYSGAPLRP